MPDVRLVEILLVEDNDLDADLTLAAADDCGLANRISRVLDGQEALDYLYQHSPYEHVRRPDLILLDLNLPGIDGREVLHTIKSDDTLKTIPVVVLTTSIDDADVLGAYSSGSNAYIQKPVESDGFLSVMRTLEDFWIGLVVLPNQAEEST